MVTKNLIPKGLWYQEAVIKGIKMPTKRTNDTNENRWNSFIKPMFVYKLPQEGDERLFIELGCNAGFYLRKAVDLGYRAIGVENNSTYIGHAKYWEKQDPKGVSIVDSDLNLYKLPAAYVILLANVHYWLSPEELTTLVDKLSKSAIYVIVVGRNKSKTVHKSACDKDSLKKSFCAWKSIKIIPAEKHYSALFKNPNLIEKDTEELFDCQPFIKSTRFLSSYTKLIEKVLTGEKVDYITDDYYKYILWRRFKKPELLWQKHCNLIKNVAEYNIMVPINVGRNHDYNKLDDGNHRLIIANYLGIRKVICQKT